jgi:hypothetical protein
VILSSLLGAALGGRSTDIASGALIGELLGRVSACSTAEAVMEWQTMARTLETTPVGTAFTWRNPHSSHRGTIIPSPTPPRPALTSGIPVDCRRRPDPASEEHRVPAAERLVADPDSGAADSNEDRVFTQNETEGK